MEQQDLADQRYYAVGTGRFNVPDPYRASGGASDPGSWNRYTYVGGDPINTYDPSGLVRVCPRGSHVVYGPGGPTNNWCEPDDLPAQSPRPVLAPTSTQIAIDHLRQAQEAIMDRDTFSPECTAGLERLGIDVESLVSGAASLNFRDGSLTNTLVGDAYADRSLGRAAQADLDKQFAGYLKSHNLEHLTIAAYFDAKPGMDAWTPMGGGTIFFSTSRLPTGIGARNQGLLMHETLHAIWGMDDTDVMNLLKIPAADQARGSVAITDWMTSNCVRGAGNR